MPQTPSTVTGSRPRNCQPCPDAPVGVDPAAAEVRDEEIAAEAAESGRRERNAPRLVQLVGAADVGEQPSVEVELVDVAAVRRIVAVHRGTVRVGDEDPVADRLDAERCVPVGLLAIDERAGLVHAAPLGVEDEDPVVVEVRRVQLPARERDPAEERAGRAGVDGDDGQPRPASGDRRRPGPDHPVLARVDESRRPGSAVAANDESAPAVEDDAGRPTGNGHRQRLLPPVTRVERARAPALVRDPPRALAARRQAPRVDQVGVGPIGDEHLLGEAVEAGSARRRRRGQGEDDDRERAELHVPVAMGEGRGARDLLAMKSRYQ